MVGGFLSRTGRSVEQVKVAVEAITRAAGDDEWKDRRTAAKDAAEAHRAGRHAYGLQAMRQHFGKAVADQAAEWLSYTETKDAKSDEGSTEKKNNAESGEQVAFPMVPFESIRLDTEDRDYLIKGLLPRSGLAVIWGPPKCYKSFWATDTALYIAAGREYLGRRVQQAPVVLCRARRPQRTEKAYRGISSVPQLRRVDTVLSHHHAAQSCQASQ